MRKALRIDPGHETMYRQVSDDEKEACQYQEYMNGKDEDVRLEELAWQETLKNEIGVRL